MDSKLWEGRLAGGLNGAASDYNSSIRVDSRMYREDILGSLAHAQMLCETGIISAEDHAAIQSGLNAILEDISSRKLAISPEAEDIHTFVEAELTRRVGAPGKKLHTARSRNDQVATDVRLYLKGQAESVISLLAEMTRALTDKAEKYTEAIMPGYTHLQRAQPVSFAQQLLAYAQMFLRDMGRIADAKTRMNRCPLGAGALAGTSFPIDRELTSRLLGFDAPCLNSIDAVSDRDFCVELASALSLIMTHLSRLSEEIILWSSWEFRFVELADEYSTGSSIMPQKKNPDLAELTRGKTGRVNGDLMALLTMLKGLPLAYNKDMQEDKEAIFDSFDTVKAALNVCIPMLKTMSVKTENMLGAAARGFINATDAADYLAAKGVPFRDAYKAVGSLVKYLISEGKTLESAELADYQRFCPAFESDVYKFISLDACLKRRNSLGGTSPGQAALQIASVRAELSKYE